MLPEDHLLTILAAPLLAQGEANSADPNGYECLLPAMITDWRASWATVGSDPQAPFLFVQLAPWPDGDTGVLPIMRVAMEAALALPKVGMAVAADMGDPAGAMHPIHPPWKAEVARRTWLWADNVIYGNTASPTSGPVVRSVTIDKWQPSWGDYHFGYGAAANVCGSGQFTCAGVRVTFDRAVTLRSFYQPAAATVTLDGADPYGWITGAASGFELWYINPENSNYTWWQPAALTGLRDGGFTLQLNVTWICPNGELPQTLRYGWHDYPHAMPIISADGFALPASPFNATVQQA